LSACLANLTLLLGPGRRSIPASRSSRVQIGQNTPLYDKKSHAENIQDMLKVQKNHTKHVKNQLFFGKKKVVTIEISKKTTSMLIR